MLNEISNNGSFSPDCFLFCMDHAVRSAVAQTFGMKFCNLSDLRFLEDKNGYVRSIRNWRTGQIVFIRYPVNIKQRIVGAYNVWELDHWEELKPQKPPEKNAMDRFLELPKEQQKNVLKKIVEVFCWQEDE